MKGGCILVVIVIATVGLTVATTDRKLRPWQKEEFPNPETAPDLCHSQSRLCDPDGILLESEIEEILGKIHHLETTQPISCGKTTDNTVGSKEPVQFVVAVVSRMDLIPFGPYEDREERAAEVFATHLHNEWGVGAKTPCGGTGVLLFLSILDRALFISRGKAVEAVITDKRLDRVISGMKTWLQRERYGRAIQEAIKEMQDYLAAGEPTLHERRMDALLDLIPIAFFLCVIGVIVMGVRQQRHEQREYARVESQLNRIDRDRAEALQGRYQCTSCPICLEDFSVSEDGTTKQGSDGLPLKLLRCGHVFDETCWNEWVTSGRGNVRRCPICQQDVGPQTTTTTTTNITDASRQPPLVRDDNNNDSIVHHNTAGENRVFQQFNRERNFRLARLGTRYPRYVRPDLIQRWTQSTYDGTLSRDPNFIRSNPRHHHSGNNGSRFGGGGSSFGGSSFGGGSSSGGRGGSW